MKNIFCLFERPFKRQRYWCFSIMQIRSVMTPYCLQLKMVKYWINDISGNILHERHFNDHKICDIIKILGVYFGYDEKQRNDLNFRQTLKSIKKSIHKWKWRNLSILGKLQIIKTFAIPKLLFRASVIPMPNDLTCKRSQLDFLHFYLEWQR